MSYYDRWKTRSDRDDNPSEQDHDPDERFDVWQFFPDGLHERVREGVSAKEAVEAAHHYATCPAARIGIVRRVIIVGDGDDCVFEWLYGQGVTFPTASMHVEYGP